jgi:hypothetical protein
MIAHVNEEAIVLRFDSIENLPSKEWDALLDELKSHHIPGLYPYGKRSSVDVSGPKPRVVIYLTSETVTMDQAIAILKKRHIEVFDARENPSAL